MKIGVISDLHLQSRYYTKQHNNVLESLSGILTDFSDLNVDLVFIAGDLFDKVSVNIPTILSMKDLLLSFPFTYHIIAGNHDMHKLNSREHSIVSLLEAENKIHVYVQKPKVIEISSIKTLFVFYPYMTYDKQAELIEDTFNYLFERLDSSMYNSYKKILISHFDFGIYTNNKQSLKTPSTLPESLVLRISQYFDMVLNGHIHTYTEFSPNMFYLGSLTWHSFESKIKIDKVINIDDFDKKYQDKLKVYHILHIANDTLQLETRKNDFDKNIYIDIDLTSLDTPSKMKKFGEQIFKVLNTWAEREEIEFNWFIRFLYTKQNKDKYSTTKAKVFQFLFKKLQGKVEITEKSIAIDENELNDILSYMELDSMAMFESLENMNVTITKLDVLKIAKDIVAQHTPNLLFGSEIQQELNKVFQTVLDKYGIQGE